MIRSDRDSHDYDVVVVGARPAGAATAMLLAREGVRVLAVDRGRYGSDTLSTHALMRAGVLQLSRWGLLDAVRAAGTPVIRRTRFHYGSEILDVPIRSSDGVDGLYAPRRTVLDPILVDAARDAGAEVRYGFTVDGVRRDATGRVLGVSGRDESGEVVEISATVTVGADGMRSRIARAVEAPVTRAAGHQGGVVFGYFEGLDLDSYEWLYQPGIAGGLIPTNDGITCVFVSTTASRFRREIQGDLAGGFRRILRRLSPKMASRVESGRQVGRFRGFPGLAGYLRRPWGPGWALVGDAGYFKDPITAHGISDALRDAELLSRSLVVAVEDSGRGEAALAGYETTRDRLSGPLFEITDEVAGYAWTLDEISVHLRQLSRAMAPEVRHLLALDAGPMAA